MVRFGQFRIRNAHPFVAVDLDFNRRGLVRLKGANGAGKSSLVNLLTFLYFGSHPNKATKSDIMAETKNFLLESYFYKDDVAYCVALSTKSKEENPMGEAYDSGFFFFKQIDGTWQNISQHKALDTQKLVRDTLGWSLDEWYGYVVLGQKTSHTMISGTRSERQRYLSSLFRLDPLDLIHEYYKKQAELLSVEISEIERKKHEAEVLQDLLLGYRDLARIEKELVELQAEEKEERTALLLGTESQKLWDARVRLAQEAALIGDVADQAGIRETLQTLREEKAAADGNLQRLTKLKADRALVRAKLDGLPSDYPADYEAVMAGPDLDLAQTDAQIQKLQKIEQDLSRSALLTKPADLPPDAEKILSGPDINLIRVEAEIKSIRNRPAPPTVERCSPEQLQDVVDATANMLAAQISFRAEISRLQVTGDECPTCGQSLNCEERGTQKADAEQNLAMVTESLAAAQAEAEELRTAVKLWADYDKLGPDRTAELPALEAEVSDYRKKIQYGDLKKQHEQFEKQEALRAEVTGLSEMKERAALYRKKVEYRSLSEKMSAREDLNRQLAFFDEEIPKIPNEDVSGHAAVISELEKELEKSVRLQNIGEELARMPETVTDRSEEIRTHQANIESLSNSQQGLKRDRDKINELTTKINELILWISERAEVYRKQKKCEVLTKAYGKAGKIRQLQLSRFCRYLEGALMAHTLRQLPNYRFYFVAEEGVDLLVSKDGSKPYDVSFMSGGEQGALSVALLFALDDMQIPERRTAFKVVDESEAAFDVDRKADFIDATLPALKERAETVIVISHTEVSNPVTFDRTWLVRNGQVEDVSREVRA